MLSGMIKNRSDFPGTILCHTIIQKDNPLQVNKTYLEFTCYCLQIVGEYGNIVLLIKQ